MWPPAMLTLNEGTDGNSLSLSLSLAFSLSHSHPTCKLYTPHATRISGSQREAEKWGIDVRKTRERRKEKRERRAKNDGQLMSRRWAGELRRAKSGNDALLYFSSHPPLCPGHSPLPRSSVFLSASIYPRQWSTYISSRFPLVWIPLAPPSLLFERKRRSDNADLDSPTHSLTSPLRLSRKSRLLRDDSCRETGQHARVRSDVFHLE